MSTQEHGPTGTAGETSLAKIRARLEERRAYAEHQRGERVPPVGEWTGTLGYWTGAADAYNLAIAAIKALEAS